MSNIGIDDFTGFTFDGLHSSQFNIIVTSNGNRYSEDLFPAPKDTTIDMPRRDGLVFVSSKQQTKNFSLSIAYDDLTEEQFRQMRQWLSKKELAPLIFDERPYKKYMVKASGAPKLNFICFDEPLDDVDQIKLVETNSPAPASRRIYKGEGSINFVCYGGVGLLNHNGLNIAPILLNNYSYENKSEWAVSSKLLASDVIPTNTMIYDLQSNLIDASNEADKYGVPTKTIGLYNPGDTYGDFILTFDATVFTQDCTFSLMSEHMTKPQIFIINFSQLTQKYSTGYYTLDTKNNIFYIDDGKSPVLLAYAFVGKMPKLDLGTSVLKNLTNSNAITSFKTTIYYY